MKYACNYINGDVHGFAELRDSTGRLLITNYFFHNLPLGPISLYEADSIKKYSYYDFDGAQLFNINYDSANGVKITDLQDRFFFHHVRPSQNERGTNNNYLFMYLLDPPKYDFTYELVTIDDTYEVKNIEQKIDNSLVFKKILLPPENSEPNRHLAIRLTIYDSINELENVMFKVLVNE